MGQVGRGSASRHALSPRPTGTVRDFVPVLKSEAAVARDGHTHFAKLRRTYPAKLLDRGRDLSHLLRGVEAGVSPVKHQRGGLFSDYAVGRPWQGRSRFAVFGICQVFDPSETKR